MPPRLYACLKDSAAAASRRCIPEIQAAVTGVCECSVLCNGWYDKHTKELQVSVTVPAGALVAKSRSCDHFAYFTILWPFLQTVQHCGIRYQLSAVNALH